MTATIEKAFLDAGFKPSKLRTARPAKINKCRKCGGKMEMVCANVMCCTGDIEVKSADGETVRTVPCTNRVIFTNSK